MEGPATLSGTSPRARPLLDDRVVAFAHNLVDVLLLPGIRHRRPSAVVGAGVGRLPAPSAAPPCSACDLRVTTLAFPVSTTWGTYLHAAVPPLVLLVVASAVALDAGIAAVGRRRRWTRPVAWLGPLFAGFAALLFMSAGIPSYAAQAADIQVRYAALAGRFAALGDPLDPAVPVIANHPMWVAEANRVRALALPDEPVSSVLEIARTFGARYVILDGSTDTWPSRLATDPQAGCLTLVPLPGTGGALDGFRVYRVSCP